MSFVQPEASKSRLSIGVGIAIAFHVGLAWALASGLGHQVMQAVAAPIETRLIEEHKPPPPPPKTIEMPPPPKFTPPPPAFVPPPEVQVQAPPPAQPTITATVAEPPRVIPDPTPSPPVAVAPPAPPAPAPTPAPAPVRVSASVSCSNYAQVMGDASFPREAKRLGLDEGNVVIQFTLAASGEVKEIQAISATHPSFANGAMRIVREFKCKGQGRDVTVQVPFAFKSN